MWVYLNGKFLLQEEAKISPLDRSVTFGDGVYEVIPSYEGSKSNLFIVKDDLILTPPLSQNILPGITRNHVLRNLKKFGMKFKEENISLESLLQADEVWLTSSTKEVQPVSTIDTHKLPQINPQESLWKKVLDSF